MCSSADASLPPSQATAHGSGSSGSLLLHRIGLGPTTHCRSPGALKVSGHYRNSHDQAQVCPLSPRPDAETVMRQLPAWIAHYNEVHPHKALGYRSPREFIAAEFRVEGSLSRRGSSVPT